MERAGHALGVREAFAGPQPRSLRSRILLWTLGVPLAVVGVVANALPWAVVEWIARRWARDPNHLGFARIAAGLMVFPAAYAAWTWFLAHTLDLEPAAVAAAVALMPFAGLSAWWHAGRLKQAYDRRRIARLVRTHPALHARITRAQALLTGPANRHERRMRATKD